MAKDVTAADDDAKLQALGYQPLLKRNLSAFSNFATSFAIISILVSHACIARQTKPDYVQSTPLQWD